MECSFCKKEIKEKLGFKNVFSKKESFILCESCKKVLNINIEHLGEYTLYYFADYEFLKDSIYAIKYGGDVEECLKYKSLFRKFFEEYNFDLVTLVPANNERKIIRSFDHIEQLCILCNVKFEKILDTDYRPKQAKLHKQRVGHPFYTLFHCESDLSISKVLIIDDIFTSGNTLLSCAKPLKELFPNSEISFLVLAKSMH